jgi:hypothetical protein
MNFNEDNAQVFKPFFKKKKKSKLTSPLKKNFMIKTEKLDQGVK